MNDLTSNTIDLDTEITAQNTEGVIFVNINAIDGENDGTSWDNAYTDLQSALAAAGASNQIWVAQGTYLPVTGNNLPEDVEDPREVSFVINNGVKVYGGFAGAETALEQRDIEANPTILSGNIGEDGQGDNSYHVVDITDSPASTSIDGFTITGGQADGDSGFDRQDHGGGLFGRSNAGATLQNLIIENNFAVDDGGAVYAEDSGININSTVFNNNSSGASGGAIFASGNSLNVLNSLFFNNQGAGRGGGAISTNTLVTFDVVNNTFYDNQGGGSDDIFDDSGSFDSRTISNNIFADSNAIDTTKIFLDFSVTPRVLDINTNLINGTVGFRRNQIEVGDFGEGNVSEDPLFVDPAGSNFNLQLSSPGIDGGNNSVVSTASENTDVANNPRIYNETVDIGAYEYGLYVNIDDVEIAEGDEGTTNAEFTATLLDTLGQPTTEEVTVNYTTVNDVASAENNDFTADSGTLVFAPEETAEAITVAINGDTDQEESETFFVNLSDATGAAVIQDGQGLGVIQNDDLLGATSTVYRFFNPNVGVHFYTASEAERDAVLENNDQYNFEGPSYLTAPETDDPLTGISPVYRFLNTNTGVHLYTIDEAERTSIVENLDNYSFEGVAYYGYEEQQEGTIPLYRLYNPVIGTHFYTPSEAEKDAVIENLPDYELEGDGIGFYVQPLDI